MRILGMLLILTLTAQNAVGLVYSHDDIVGRLKKYAEANNFNLTSRTDMEDYLLRAKQYLKDFYKDDTGNFTIIDKLSPQDADVRSILQNVTQEKSGLISEAWTFIGGGEEHPGRTPVNTTHAWAQDITEFKKIRDAFYKKYITDVPFMVSGKVSDKDAKNQIALYLNQASRTLAAEHPYLYYTLSAFKDSENPKLTQAMLTGQKYVELKKQIPQQSLAEAKLKLLFLELLKQYAQKNHFTLTNPLDNELYLKRAKQVITTSEPWTKYGSTEAAKKLVADLTLEDVAVKNMIDVEALERYSDSIPYLSKKYQVDTNKELPKAFLDARTFAYTAFAINSPPSPETDVTEYLQYAKMVLENEFPFLFYNLAAFDLAEIASTDLKEILNQDKVKAAIQQQKQQPQQGNQPPQQGQQPPQIQKQIPPIQQQQQPLQSPLQPKQPQQGLQQIQQQPPKQPQQGQQQIQQQPQQQQQQLTREQEQALHLELLRKAQEAARK